MKRYLKYILLALISVALAVSCIEELEPTPSMTANDEVAVLVPRIKSFTNQYVTRSDYSEAEMTISSLKVLVFNNDGRLVRHDDIPVDTRTISLNKSMLNSSANGELTNATVVMLANMDLSRLKKGNTPLSSNLSNLQLSDLENYSYSHEQSVYTSLPSGFKGFPMIGGTTGVDLSPTSTSNQQAPVIVDLKILYAKVNFQISVEQGGENQRVDPSNTQLMQFQLDKYAVYNASAVTALAIPTTEGEPVRDFLGNIPDAENIASVDEPTLSSTYSYTSGSGASLNISKTVALGGASIPFTFYIAESRYNHNLLSLTGIYPDDEWLTSAQNDDVKGWDTLTEDQKKLPQNKLNGVKYLYDDLIQQYKPKLADVENASPGKGLASYVLLTGKYTDYRGTVWDVNYKVYLGKDNSQNFHVDRNSEYTNHITIKGIRNNDGYGNGDVWVDHRVNVSTTDPSDPSGYISITRETLIDAHIEVRPLRVKYGTDYQFAVIYLPKYPLDQNGNIIYGTTEPKSWGQVVEKEGGENENWIALENNNGKYNKGKLYSTNGKRKYFTTSLIEELHLDNNAEENGIRSDDNGNRYILLNSEDCAWIYFDENTTPNPRRARIEVSFYDTKGNMVVETYEIIQSGLKEVGKYKIERYEEYLHSYDSEDTYGLATSPTDYTQQGLSWGFFNQPISQDIIVSATPLVVNVGGTDLLDFRPVVEQRYDYFHELDVSNPPYYLYTKNDKDSWTDASYGTGLTFTDRASSNEFITVKDMDTRPTSAYQYCLSKNKFAEDPDGEDHQMIIHWYLPDAYELRDLLNSDSSTSDSDILKTDAYYWSSQPSFDGISINLGTELSLKNEVPANARAVSKDGIVDIERRRQNRIRCFYDSTGILADMNDRVPEGLGGLIKVPMKAFDEDNSRGYFYDWLQEIEDESDTPEPPTYDFPTGKTFNTFETYTHNNVTYYAVDPSVKNNWSYQLLSQTLSYYPGLSSKNIQIGTDLIYREQSTDKEYQRTETDFEGQIIDAIPSNEDLFTHPLDLYQEDNKNSGILTIAFDQGSGNSSPSYSYRREDKNTTTTYTRKWEVPQYEEVHINETSGSNKTGIQVSLLVYLANEVNDEYVYEGITYIITRKYTSGSIFSLKYNFDLGPITINKTVYTYKEGTGGWGQENKSISYPTPQSTIDQLELFGGNQLTISAIDGYRIRSIRVNYSGSNEVPTILTNRFLRLVDSQTSVPMQSNQSPRNMSYSPDGERGWFKWTASSDTDLVSNLTLRLVAYTVSDSYTILGFNIPGSFQYVQPERDSGLIPTYNDLAESIIIDSIEIRVEEIE